MICWNRASVRCSRNYSEILLLTLILKEVTRRAKDRRRSYKFSLMRPTTLDSRGGWQWHHVTPSEKPNSQLPRVCGSVLPSGILALLWFQRIRRDEG